MTDSKRLELLLNLPRTPPARVREAHAGDAARIRLGATGEAGLLEGRDGHGHRRLQKAKVGDELAYRTATLVVSRVGKGHEHQVGRGHGGPRALVDDERHPARGAAAQGHAGRDVATDARDDTPDLAHARVRQGAADAPAVGPTHATLDEAKLGKVPGPVRHGWSEHSLVLGYLRSAERLAHVREVAHDAKLVERDAAGGRRGLAHQAKGPAYG